MRLVDWPCNAADPEQLARQAQSKKQPKEPKGKVYNEEEHPRRYASLGVATHGEETSTVLTEVVQGTGDGDGVVIDDMDYMNAVPAVTSHVHENLSVRVDCIEGSYDRQTTSCEANARLEPDPPIDDEVPSVTRS